MTQVQGHSIEEQWDLSVQFEGLVEHAVHQTVETYIALATGKTIVAAGEFEGTPSIHVIWQKQVDTSLAPFLYATYESAALNVAHGVVNGADLPDGMGVPLVPDDHTSYYVSQVTNKMVGISDALWQDINVSLQEGVQLGEGVDELADRVRTAGSVATARAQATARTTVVQASNAGSLAQVQMIGDDSVQKEWLATEDNRTRHDHSVADGQKRPINQPFNVGGWPLQYPGDPTGPPGEVINCRCTLVYDFDVPPTHICDCVGAGVLTAASFGVAPGHVSTPTVVPATTCVGSTTASLVPPGYVSPVSTYGNLAKEGLYKKFQSPSKISPAYGGAKIHKQLQPIKDALGLTDADNEALLKIMDEQYALAGGKSSFAEKYEEWLNSPAGKKVVKVPLSAPPPVGLTAPVATAPVVVTTPATIDALYDKIIPNLTSGDEVDLYHVAYSIDKDLSKGDPWFTVWLTHEAELDTVPGFGGLALDDKLAILKKYTKKNHPYFDVDAWPDATGLPTTGVSTTVTAPTVAVPSVTVPSVVVPATVTTPATVDLLDISMVTSSEKSELLAAFKAVKPVTPNWGGSAIMKTLQEAKKSLGPDFAKFNDGQLLKMLDAASKPSAKTFFDETSAWLKTPAGKKYVADTGLPGIPAGTTGTATATTATVSAVPAVGPLGDISGIAKTLQKQIFAKLKGHGIYLSSPPSHIWDMLKKFKMDPAYSKYSDLQLLRILDEVGAENIGVANAHLYEDKLVKWMKTKPGKDHISGITPAKKVAKKAAPSYSSPYGATSAGPSGPVTLADLPRSVSTTEKSFSEISTYEAQSLQNTYAPWTAQEKASLRFYTSNNYTAMNAALRNGTNVSSSLANHIKNAQAGMRPSTRPMKLWRGTGPSQLGLRADATLTDFQALVGKTMEDKGFMSTSVGGRAAFSGKVFLEIEAPTGSQMAFVKSISHYSHEDEMLLAAGTRYKVMSVTQTGYSFTVRVRIVS